MDTNEIKGEADEIKNQTKDTIDEVKDTIKSTNFKEETKATTGFVKEILLNPFEEIRRIATEENKALGKVIIIVIALIALSLIEGMLSYHSSVKDAFKDVIMAVLNPIVFIAVYGVLSFVLTKKEERKSLITTLSTIVITYIPGVIGLVFSIVNDITKSKLYIIFGVCITVCTIAKYLFRFFAIKYLNNSEDDNETFRKFLVIEAITAFVVRLIF